MARAYLNGELDKIHEQFKKPILLTEFGADAIAGSHGTEDEIFTEEYQKKMINMYLDVANSKEYIFGMHIWNFADFRTAQAIMRVDGMNLKGVFTQNRRPKMAAAAPAQRVEKKDIAKPAQKGVVGVPEDPAQPEKR